MSCCLQLYQYQVLSLVPRLLSLAAEYKLVLKANHCNGSTEKSEEKQLDQHGQNTIYFF